MKQRMNKILKTLLYILLIVLVIAIIIYFISITKNISTKEGQANFKKKIQELGILGILLLFALELAQIFLAFLPGEPLEVFVGMCYGTIGGTIFLLVSVFIITSIIFFLVRRYGKKLVYKLCPKEKVKKIENSKLLNNTKKLESILIILFFIPGTPKDLLVYIGGLLPIKSSHFILISTFARFPSIISSTLVGANIINGNWKWMLFIYGITFIIVIIVLLFINIFDKNKDTKKVLDIIK